MTRRYTLTYLALIGLASAGWYSLATAQQPIPTFPGVPVPAANEPLIPVVYDPSTPVVPRELTPISAEIPTAPSPQRLAKNDSCVRLEWSGPASVRVGQPNDFVLTVRNVGLITVQQTMVRAQAPQGWTVVGTEPKAVSDDHVLMWQLGTMSPNREQKLFVRMTPSAGGEFDAHAWVTYTGATSHHVAVSNPEVRFSMSGPKTCSMGDGVAIVVTVTNSGSGVAEKVQLRAFIADGLEHQRGREFNIEVGNLSPGESRAIQVLMAAKAPGKQQCWFSCVGENCAASAQAWEVEVNSPKLAIEVQGPKTRYLGRKAAYVLKVVNPGQAPATGVTVHDAIPLGFTFVAASHEGGFDPASRMVSWFVGELAAGQSREVSVELVPTTAGDLTQVALATSARSPKAEAQMTTTVEGISAILLEVRDLLDPVDVGGETTYEIRITNTGTKTETDLKLSCTVPDKMAFKSATGPSAHEVQGAEVVFAHLPALAPRSEATYRVTVTALTPGIAHFKSRITSTILVEPVHKDEATRIYAD